MDHPEYGAPNQQSGEKSSDAAIVGRIDELVAEEHRLQRSHGEEGLSDADRARLAEIEVQLDQAWDLLRRRRALRHAGQDPADVGMRDSDTVEGYQQ